MVSAQIGIKEKFTLSLTYEILKETSSNLIAGFLIQNAEGVVMCGSYFHPVDGENLRAKPGIYTVNCCFPEYNFNTGKYFVQFGVDIPPEKNSYIRTEFGLSFTVEDLEGYGKYKMQLPGVLRPELHWTSVYEIQEGINVFV